MSRVLLMNVDSLVGGKTSLLARRANRFSSCRVESHKQKLFFLKKQKSFLKEYVY